MKINFLWVCVIYFNFQSICVMYSYLYQSFTYITACIYFLCVFISLQLHVFYEKKFKYESFHSLDPLNDLHKLLDALTTLYQLIN